MSKNITTRRGNAITGELPPFQQLQNTFSHLPGNTKEKKNVLQQIANCENSGMYGYKTNSDKEDISLANQYEAAECTENKEQCALTEVFSAESNRNGEREGLYGPEHEAITEETLVEDTFTDKTYFETNSAHANEIKLEQETLKYACPDYSYCTPPKALSESRDPKPEKKGGFGNREKPFSQFTSRRSALDLVTSDHNQGTQVVYGRSATNRPEPYTCSVYVPSTSEVVGLDNGQRLENALARCDRICKAGEDMEMKYTDITHMQLKRSLDQIHGQNSSRSSTSSLPNYLHNGTAPNNNPHCPLITNGNYHFPQSMSGPLPNNYDQGLINGIATPQVNNYQPMYSNGGASVSVAQSTKLDSMLHAKDAILQEKEAVILKLRLQIASLQHQVQEGDAALRQVVKSKMPTHKVCPALPTFRENQGSDLQAQKKIHDLEQLLGKTECKLKDKTTRYKTEKKDYEEKINKLECSVKNKEQANADLKNKQKSTADRLEKAKKRVECLERYLGDLPTIQESNQLKTEAGMLGEERESLVVEISTLKNKLEEKIKIITQKGMEIEKLRKNEQERDAKILQLQEKLEVSKKSKQELGRNERDELEDIKYEISRLLKEKDDAALMVSGCEKRIKQQQKAHQEELASMQDKIRDAENMTESLRRDLFLKQQASNKVHTAMKSISAQNQELLDQNLTLQDRVKTLEKLQSNTQEVSRACIRLQRETNAAVSDLKAVTQVLVQTSKGTDPNISSLLGVRNDSVSCEEDLLRQSNSDFNHSGRGPTESGLSVELTNKRLIEVRQLRKEVDEIRTLMSNQYAESIGNNCTTQ